MRKGSKKRRIARARRHRQDAARVRAADALDVTLAELELRAEASVMPPAPR